MTMKTIKLGGELARRFGRFHRVDLESFTESVDYLKGMCEGFAHYMISAKSRGIEFAVFVDGVNIDRQEMKASSVFEEVRIIPVVSGSKKGGIFQTVIGAAILAVGAVVTVFNPAIGIPMMKVGGLIALGGVIQMLSPQPRGLNMRESPDNKPSYAFGSPVNTTAQGNPIPLFYGEREVGGGILSGGIYTEDQT
ncbi:tail assembly protein [Serratia phage vB_SlqS_ZDD2]|nr:tail assembly protein [Serratia phage vB_SlqS_ZDD2]